MKISLAIMFLLILCFLVMLSPLVSTAPALVALAEKVIGRMIKGFLVIFSFLKPSLLKTLIGRTETEPRRVYNKEGIILLLSQPQLNLNSTKVGFDIKMTSHHHHHRKLNVSNISA